MNLLKSMVVLALAASVAMPGYAKARLVNAKEPNPVVEVVRDVREAVVQIKVEAKVNVSTRNNMQNPFFDDDFFRFFMPPEREMQRPVTSLGSGFIYEYNSSTKDAYIMTNNHVVEQGRNGTITVTLADKITYTGSLVGLDPNTDVAVIKITVKDGERVTVAPLGDSSQLEVGEWAIAIGNPFGEGLDRTVSLGVVSALSRSGFSFGQNSPAYQDYIQTDAAINPGNSGGPLLDINGEVIGINTAIVSSSGANAGIGLAIPINLAKRVVDDLVASGKVVRAYMGISPQEINTDIMEAFGLSEVSGVLVSKVEKDSPAEKAGFEVGDVIVEVAGEKVNNVAKFRIAVATAKIGVEIPIKIIRKNSEKTIRVVLDAYPEDSVAASDKVGASTLTTGISVESLDSQFAKRNNIQNDKGVVVTAVDGNSPAAKAGLQPGFVILSIDDIEVNSVNEFRGALATAKEEMEKSGRKTMRIYGVSRDKNYGFFVLRFE